MTTKIRQPTLVNPASLCKDNSESGHQKSLFCWAAQNQIRWPCLKWLHHIPNGGTRGDTEKSRAIAGGNLKAEGVRSGIPDVCLPVHRLPTYTGLYIEMKRPAERTKKDGGLSQSQIDCLNFLFEQKYKVAVCYSWEEAVNVITDYLEFGK